MHHFNIFEMFLLSLHVCCIQYQIEQDHVYNVIHKDGWYCLPYNESLCILELILYIVPHCVIKENDFGILTECIIQK